MSMLQKYLLLSLLVFSGQIGLVAQVKGKDAELPLVAKSAIQEMERSILLAKKKAVEKLRAVMKTEMQAGNLERANLINQAIKEIGDLTEEPLVPKTNEAIVGEWKKKDGTNITFDKKGTVALPTGWSGSWALNEKTVVVVLHTLGGKPAAIQHKLVYNLPVQRKQENRLVWVFECQNIPDYTCTKQ